MENSTSLSESAKAQTTDTTFITPEMEVELENEREFARTRTRGFVTKADGEYALITAKVAKDASDKENYWTVGQLITIKVGVNRIVGLACDVRSKTEAWVLDDVNEIEVKIELVGEIVAGKDSGKDKFSSGISSYPQMGCVAHRIRSSDLAVIYENSGESVVKVGELTQDSSIDAKIDVDKLLSRHFAVVGTTGVGKSTSVTLLMRKVIAARKDVRVLMLDPHNEFSTAFKDQSVIVDSSNLLLPFWLFKLDEFAEVVFRGQEGFDAELELLRDLIPIAKEQYKADAEKKGGGLARKQTKSSLTADMPVPYRLSDLLKAIDDRLGLLEGKSEKPHLRSLQYRLDSISNDPRFRFMFDPGPGGDIMESIISKIFRVPMENKPICVLEMSGLPTEVVNSVVSVLSRLAFEIAINSDGGIQTLVVCEEAHRYIPADASAGFWPTRQAIARIAKEGRKYGVYLSIITQRPGELDPTILSQCNTLFAMRLGNQKDQEIIRGAVTNGAKSTISFLSSIANRECIAFGEAINTPMRMTFETMRAEDLPGAHIYERQAQVKDGLEVSLSSVMRRMRQEDRKVSTQESYAGAEENASQMQDIAKAKASGPQAGDEINSILNAAYSPNNGSLNPQKSNPVPAPQPRSAPQPAAPEPQQTEAAKERRTGVNNLIKSLRSS